MKKSLAAATVFLFLVLIQPNHPQAMTWGALLVVPLELPVLVCLLVILGQSRVGQVVRGVFCGVLTLIVVLKCADLISFNALSRGFNPVADFALIDAFVRLLVGSVGPVLASLAVAGAVLAIVVIGVLMWWSMAQWARLPRSATVARLLIVPAVLAGGVAVAEIGQAMGKWTLPISLPGAAFTARVGVERVAMAQQTLAELAVFRTQVQQDPFSGARDLFDRVDRDVLVIFVESYGRTSHDTPLFAQTHRATLAKYQAQIGARGLALQSGFLSAPTRGGQSWLSHATFANGLWIDNQIRYGAALSSGRETLFHYAANNGFRTVAVMPQITLDWPESARMGFEDVLAAKDLGYNGLPFNWVTMPDQFTLAALDRLVREDDDPRPVFAQIALSSSHAPWVPVPQILPWERIGDGQVYNAISQSGDPPDVVWRDRDRIRAQYSLAVDYALSAVFEYALLHWDDPPLMIVIGDHQAAEFVALDNRPDVPIHIIGPDDLVAQLNAIAPAAGLLPGAQTPVIAMDQLRDVLLTVFSSTQSAGEGG